MKVVTVKKCEICFADYRLDYPYESARCGNCGSQYGWNEGFMLILTDRQKHVLRVYALTEGNGDQDNQLADGGETDV